MDLIDRAGDIRAGEELDANRLRDYLGPILGPVAKTLEVTQFPGGHSNLTYLLSAGSQRWVLRRPPFGSKVESAHDMSREYRILSALKDVFAFGPVPEHFCNDHEIIGCDFYLMNCIEGLVIRR
ncbi:MAG: phosphotransferase family protein, partial [Gammaproteobacteria bacterium]|nr:phosphotransferase family protein [Gammaproteobacteria bacterium]